MRKLEFIGGNEIDNLLVEELEKKLDISFPDSYVEFVTANNGTSIIPNAYNVGDSIESINDFHNIEENYHFSDERLPIGVIPFARDAGDNQICFDYRVNGKVGILFWDYEIERIEDGALSFIASSFDEFLDMLFEFDE